MKIFLDSADVEEIRSLATSGLIDGVTTNPSLVKVSGRPFKDIIKELSNIIGGPISAEVVADDFEGMVKEGNALAAIAPQVVIKVPLTSDGLRACKHFSQRGIGVNVTLCFSANQALLAAKAGAKFISPFIGRLDDCGQEGTVLLQEIRQIYDNYPEITTQILAASIRHPQHILMAAKIGCDAATIPPKVFKQLYGHPLTDKGLQTFYDDWRQTGQTIVD